jgi:regulatory protein
MSADPTPLERARAKALRLLASRARTATQIRDRLARDGMGEQAAEVLEWLERLGYVDDAVYASARARSLLAPGRLGPRLAERRLVAAGVLEPQAREAVARALQSGAEGKSADEAEARLCGELAARRLRGVSPEDLDDRSRARLARFLLGRGFSGRAVARAIGWYLDQEV